MKRYYKYTCYFSKMQWYSGTTGIIDKMLVGIKTGKAYRIFSINCTKICELYAQILVNDIGHNLLQSSYSG